MARYIDDLSMKTINQLISKNNKEICSEIFFDSKKSVKDLIIEKVMQKDDMMERSMAIEFMIELCQILKSLQFSPYMTNGSQMQGVF